MVLLSISNKKRSLDISPIHGGETAGQSPHVIFKQKLSKRYCKPNFCWHESGPFLLVFRVQTFPPLMLQANLLYISRAVSNFYGTEFVIWAGFGPVGSIENKLDHAKPFWGHFCLYVFMDIFLKILYILTVRTKKLHNSSLIKKLFCF